MGYSVFALRATQNVQNLQQQDSILHLEFEHFLVRIPSAPTGEQKTARASARTESPRESCLDKA
jgi:hypothetical protein